MNEKENNKKEELNKEELEKINGGYYVGGQITPVPAPGDPSGKSPDKIVDDKGNVGWPLLIGIPGPQD